MNVKAISVILAAVLAAGSAQGQYLEATIPLGEEPYYLLWNPDGDKVYCSSGVANTVSIIDCGTNQVIATLDVPSGPSFFARNPHLNKVYCSSGDANRISVVDGVGDTLIGSITASAWPGPMAYCEALDKLYVSCYDSRQVRVFDGTTDELLGAVRVAGGPGNLLWNPASNRVFCYTNFDSVYVIDCATDSIVARHWIGVYGGAFVRHTSSNVVYAPSRYSMHVFNAAGDSVVAQFSTVAAVPYYLCLVPYPDKLYLGDFNNAGITVIDCASNTVIDTLGSGRPWFCDTARGGKVYCLRDGMDVYDGHADTVLTHLSFGRSLVEVVASPTQGRVYVTDWMYDVVYVVRDSTTAVQEPGRAAPQARSATTVVIGGRLGYAGSRTARLLDAAGRPAAGLRPGVNDVSGIAPGIYFMLEDGSASTCKVLIVR